MSNSEQIWQGQDEASADSASINDLKSLLDTIAAQLSDADKRHSAGLEDLQSRVAAMDKDAQSIRNRVPSHYVPAFERIEAGVNEIAQRLAEAAAESIAQPVAPVAPPVAEATPVAPPVTESPVALRSAQPAGEAGSKKKDEDSARRSAPVDNFDVIESTVPGDVSDPWDHAAAEALSSHYESAGFGKPPVASQPARAQIQSVIDPVWLDSRFASIAKGIEDSLSDMRPDQGFFDLGQRFDHFEQQFSHLAESVATQSDLDALKLVEAQVGEVASQLMKAQEQLARLGVIEDQLATISAALADVHQAATAPLETEPPAAAPAHAEAIAAAAEQAATRVAALWQPAPNAADPELRPLIEQFMSQSRLGEENTTALLDTMQQAMIRLLDRVDAIEFTQHQNINVSPSPQEYVREQVRFVDQSRRSPDFADENDDAFDAAAAAVASAKAMSPTHETSIETEAQPQQARSARAPEKSRQDFIAEARRAKLRLAAVEPEGDAIVIPAPAPIIPEEFVRPIPSPAAASRPIRTAPLAAAAKAAGPSAPSPRLIVIAAAALMALGGLWLTLDGNKPSAVKPVALTPPVATSAATSQKANPADAINDPDLIEGGRSSGGVGPRSDAGPSAGTVGEVVPASTDEPAKTALPMMGVAVDLDRPITQEGLDQARRHETMASMSGELGAAAARSANEIAAPAVLVPKDADVKAAPSALKQADAQATMGASSRSELPAATVGPLSLRLAAANGDPSAQFEVGARFAEGKGTTQSFKDAAKWYQRAADQGSVQAQYRLGTLYERGLGVRADAAQAAAWYQKAAEQGNVKAMHNLAVLSANQSGQPPDYITAAQWFEKAAERGLSDSQFNLAILYENGLGVKADVKEAYKWLALAARGGDKEAVKRRDIIRGKLTADELRTAETMLSSWRAIPMDKTVNDSRLAGEAWKKNPKNGISG